MNAFSRVTRAGFASLCTSDGVSNDLASKVNQSLLGSTDTLTDDIQ